MSKLKLATAVFALTLASVAAQAQSTPQAVVANAPSLPTPQQWAANKGHTEEFKNKLAELNSKLNEQTFNLVPNVTQQDLEESMANQRRQQEQMNSQLQQNFGFNINDIGNMTEAELEARMRAGMAQMQAQGMAQLNKEMAALMSMGITEADFRQMERMNDRQSEAFMKRRLAENGITEAEFERRMAAAGVPVMSDAEWREEERRQQQTQADAEAVMKAEQTLEAYIEQMQITNQKIADAEKSASDQISALWESRKPAIEEIRQEIGRLGGWEEVGRGTITAEQIEAANRRIEALMNEFRTAAYQIWATDYIGVAQGQTKILLQYAETADAARANLPSMTGNAATDRLQRMSNYAITVAAQYLGITGSEPAL